MSGKIFIMDIESEMDRILEDLPFEHKQTIRENSIENLNNFF